MKFRHGVRIRLPTLLKPLSFLSCIKNQSGMTASAWRKKGRKGAQLSDDLNCLPLDDRLQRHATRRHHRTIPFPFSRPDAISLDSSRRDSRTLPLNKASITLRRDRLEQEDLRGTRATSPQSSTADCAELCRIASCDPSIFWQRLDHSVRIIRGSDRSFRVRRDGGLCAGRRARLVVEL